MRSLVGALLNKTPVPQTGRAGTGLFAGLTGTRGMTAQMRAMGEVGTLFAIVSRTSNATSQVEWKLWRKAKSGKKEDRVEVVSHPALDLWNQPNKFTTRQELVEAGQQHVDLTGEGWLVIGRNPKVRNLPLELWTVRPDRMAPVEDRDDFIAGYTYTAPDGEVVPLERDDVLMLRMPNPLDPYRGMGPVQAILTNIDSAKYSAEWNRNFFLNSAEPGGVIEVPTRLSDAEWAEMNTRWREQHQGVANAHRVAVIEQGKWVNRTFSMRDMQFAELREVSRDVMLEAFGFPKFMLGAVDDVNRANAEASAAMFAQWLVRPRLERWKGMLNNDLLPLYGAVGQGLEFDYENPVPPDGEAENAARDSKVKAVATLVPLGFDADEAMEFFGLPAIKFEKPEPPAPEPPPASSGESGAPAAPAEGAPRARAGGSFLELAGRFRTRSGVVARHLGPQGSRTYKRDKDGKFSSGGGSGGDWKPTMSRDEADAWSEGSKVPFDLFHGTTPEAAQAIREHGFDMDRAGSQTDSGNLGQAVYFTPSSAMAYGKAPGYGETLTVRAKIDHPLMTSSEEYARQVAISAVVDVTASFGHRMGEAHLDSPASTTPTATWKPPPGMTNRELIGDLKPGQLDSWVEVQKSQGGPAAVRKIAIDRGYDAVIWEFPGTALPGRPAGAEDWYEIAVLSDKALTVIGDGVGPANRAAVRSLPTDQAENVDMAKVQRDWERQLDTLLAQWFTVTAKQRDQILDQVRSAVTADDLAALARLNVSSTEQAQILTEAMSAMALQAAERMSDEAARQGVRIDPVASDTADFAASATALASLLGAGLAAAAGREALRRWSPSTSGDDVAAAVRAHMDALSTAMVETSLGGALTSAQNTGRLNTAMSGPSVALYASEHNDDRVCGPCHQVDGRFIGNSDDPDIMAKMAALYPNGGYVDCEGGARCRGTIVSVYRPEQVSGAG